MKKAKYEIDVSTFSKELQLLLLFLKLDNLPEDDETILENHKYLFLSTDWNHFLELADHHRVYPNVYQKVKKLDKKWVPAFVVQELQMKYQKNTFRMLHLCAEMERIAKIFHENNIHSLHLKGPVLAEQLYGDISMRTSKDLDILVPEEEIERIDQLLFSLGYEKLASPSVLNELKWRHHHFSFVNNKHRISLEIHWRLTPFPGNEPSFEELWERRQLSKLSKLPKLPIFYLSNKDLFLYLVSHGARHGWFRLKWLYDINKYLSKIKLEVSFLKKNEFRNERLIGQALILANKLFYSPLKVIHINKKSYKLSSKVIVFIREIIILNPIPDHLRPSYRRYLFSLNCTHVQKILSFFILFYPSYYDKSYINLPAPVHSLYFLLRPFIGLFRIIKKS